MRLSASAKPDPRQQSREQLTYPRLETEQPLHYAPRAHWRAPVAESEVPVVLSQRPSYAQTMQSVRKRFWY